MSAAGLEHDPWVSDKALWAVLLFMQYPRDVERWRPIRKAILAEITEPEDTKLRACWAAAKKEGRL